MEKDTFSANKNNPYLLETEAVPFKTDTVKPKTYERWKLGTITLNGQERESLPATLQDSDVVVFSYISIYENATSSLTAKYIDEDGNAVADSVIKSSSYSDV